jgi:hypothetical protein
MQPAISTALTELSFEFDHSEGSLTASAQLTTAESCRRKGGPAKLEAFADHVKSLWRKV